MLKYNCHLFEDKHHTNKAFKFFYIKRLWENSSRKSQRADIFKGFIQRGNIKILPKDRELTAQSPPPYNFTIVEHESRCGVDPTRAGKTPLYSHCLAHVDISEIWPDAIDIT